MSKFTYMPVRFCVVAGSFACLVSACSGSQKNSEPPQTDVQELLDEQQKMEEQSPEPGMGRTALELDQQVRSAQAEAQDAGAAPH